MTTKPRDLSKGFYWNSEWAASLTPERRAQFGWHERGHLRFHLYKMTRPETLAISERIAMFERGEPCPDLNDAITTIFDLSYGTADGKARKCAIDEALQEIEEFLRS